MSRFTKFSSQVPEVVRERFMELQHGDKQLVCTGALVWYFNADEETRRLYRDWGRAIAEGYASIRTPPDGVRTLLKRRRAKRGGSRKNTGKRSRSG